MPRGYAEGPAAEEAERRLDESERGVRDDPRPERAAVYGATEDEPESHFLGWVGDVDPDAFFRSGRAWGLTVRRVAG